MLYQEIYFASYDELNDPIVSARIDFSPTELERIEFLTWLAFKTSICSKLAYIHSKKHRKQMNITTQWFYQGEPYRRASHLFDTEHLQNIDTY